VVSVTLEGFIPTSLPFSLFYVKERKQNLGGYLYRRVFCLFAKRIQLTLDAFRFIFGAVLGRNLNYRIIPKRRQYREFRAFMSKTEIVHFFSLIENLRNKAIFETVYGAGLRICSCPFVHTGYWQ
jgi:hypothetical protein